MKSEKEKLVEMFKKMLDIRHFEEKAFDLYGQNLVPGTLHLYAGQEAVAVGVCANLRKEDYVTSTHRGHGHCIAKGAKIDRVMTALRASPIWYCAVASVVIQFNRAACVSLIVDSVRPIIVTEAPSWASQRAIALPIPPDPPVISAAMPISGCVALMIPPLRP